jgi:hypothetical protein
MIGNHVYGQPYRGFESLPLRKLRRATQATTSDSGLRLDSLSRKPSVINVATQLELALVALAVACASPQPTQPAPPTTSAPNYDAGAQLDGEVVVTETQAEALARELEGLPMAVLGSGEVIPATASVAPAPSDASVASDAGPKKVAGPKGSATIGAIAGETPDGTRAKVVASARAGLKACYNRGLAENPEAKGSLQVALDVDPAGSVTNASVNVTQGTIPSSVVYCAKARVQSLQFPASKAGASKLSFRVELERK